MSFSLQLLALAGTGQGAALTREHFMASAPLAAAALKSGVVWDEEEILHIFQSAQDEAQSVPVFENRLQQHFDSKIRQHRALAADQASLALPEPPPRQPAAS